MAGWQVAAAVGGREHAGCAAPQHSSHGRMCADSAVAGRCRDTFGFLVPGMAPVVVVEEPELGLHTQPRCKAAPAKSGYLYAPMAAECICASKDKPVRKESALSNRLRPRGEVRERGVFSRESGVGTGAAGSV